MLFITSNHPLQKDIQSVAIKQLFTERNSVHEFFCVKMCSTHIQSYLNAFKWCNSQLMGSRNIAYLTIVLDDFHYFIDIFNNWPSRAWCIFDIKITGTALMKQKLCVISYYNKHYSLLQSLYLYRKKTVKYGVFSLCWCPSLMCALTVLRQVIIKLSDKLFNTKCYLSNSIQRNPTNLYNVRYFTRPYISFRSTFFVGFTNYNFFCAWILLKAYSTRRDFYQIDPFIFVLE